MSGKYEFTGLRNPNYRQGAYQGAPAPDMSWSNPNMGRSTNMAQGLDYQTDIQQPDPASDVVGGAVTGGAAGGPWGAAIMGGAGMLKAGLTAKAAQKQQERQLRSRAFERQGQIEQSRGQEKNVALSNIISALRSAMIGG